MKGFIFGKIEESKSDDAIAEVSEGMQRLSEYIGKCLERPSEEDEKNE